MMDSSNRPAVIDMSEINDDKDESEAIDKEVRDEPKQPSSSARDVLISRLTSTVWAESKEKAETFYKSYATVDFLRPYFDVEPKEVLHRLVTSFVPVKNGDLIVPAELYGPIMTCLTLIAFLLYEMKSSGTKVQEGTLMGSAMITCFGYWLGVSAIMWVVAYVGNTKLRPVQINTIMGYALTGHCVVVLVGSLIHIGQSHVPFSILCIVCGGLCSARVVTIFWVLTPGHIERIVAAVVVVLLHMGFMLYLHFAYHIVVKDLANVMNHI